MLDAPEETARKRKMLGLTQKKLAEMAGVSQSLIAKMESGKIDPAYTKVKAIFEALELLETRVDFHAREILHDEVVGIQKEASVSEAVQQMIKHGYSQLPVFDGEHSVGSVSEKSALNQVLAGKDLKQISKLLVKDVMEEAFPQVSEDAPLSLLSSLLQVYSAVLIVRKGKVIGIVTKADLLKMLE
jgi:predicted transcriptional regulator